MPAVAKGKANTNGKPKSDIARSEVKDGLRTVETHGLKLTIPAKLPFSVLQFLEKPNPGPPEIVGVLKAILKPADQIQQVWDAGLDMDEGGEVIRDLISASGVSPGESGASRDS